MRTLTATFVLLLCCLAGCEGTTEPLTSVVMLAANPDVVHATQDTSTQAATGRRIVWVGFDVELKARNAGSRPVYFESCGAMHLERRAADATWSPVWGQACGGSQVVELSPGAEWSGQLDVTGALSGPGGPEFRAETVPGEYRVVLHVVRDSTRLHDSAPSEPYVHSDVFTIVQ